MVVVESENAEKNRQFVERLGAKLEAEPKVFHNVFYKGDLKMLGPKALLFVPDDKLEVLSQTLKDFNPFLTKFTRTTNLLSLFNMVCAQFRTAKPETNAANQSLVKVLPALERIIAQATDSLRRSGTPPSPGVTALFDPGDEAQRKIYITFDNGRIYLVTCQAPDAKLNSDAVVRLRQLVDETQMEVPGLNVGLTGEPVLEMDEMAQSQKDTAVAAVVSLVLSALIFIYGYEETGRPVKATFCLIIGLGYTLGFATLAVGHLNILTITFLPILIGLAIDYGVHLISRYEEELRHGRSEEAALTKAMVFTGQGIFTGGLTTAGGFLAMGFTDFKGIQEMGIICGGGLLICLIPMMTMLPVLLLRGRQNVIDHEQGDLAERGRGSRTSGCGGRSGPPASRWRCAPWRPRSSTKSTSITTCSTCRARACRPWNMKRTSSPRRPSPSCSAPSSPPTFSRPPRWSNSLPTSRPWPASIPSPASWMRTRPASWRWSATSSGSSPPCASATGPKPVDLQELSATLYSLRGYLGAALDVVQKEAPELVPQFNSLRHAIEALRKEMLRGDTNQVAANALKLAEYQQSLFDDVRDTFEALRTRTTAPP